MKKTFWKIFDIIVKLIFVGIVAFLCYSLFFTEEKDVKLISKLVGLFITYVIYLLSSRKHDNAYKKVVRAYEEQYKDIIGGTFPKDKRSYKNLLQAIVFYNTDEFEKAHKLLDKLLKKCKSKQDYSAVYMFHALCFVDETKMDDAIAAYQKLLQYDSTNSRAWSNLGLRYMEKGRMAEARVAYGNALMYNPDNPYAYNNLGTCYLRMGEPQPALDYALKALQINGTLYQAMGLAAMAYKSLGDTENAEKYCNMYGANGGDAGDLRKTLKYM